jgi:hypothetical protein
VSLFYRDNLDEMRRNVRVFGRKTLTTPSFESPYADDRMTLKLTLNKEVQGRGYSLSRALSNTKNEPLSAVKGHSRYYTS